MPQEKIQITKVTGPFWPNSKPKTTDFLPRDLLDQINVTDIPTAKNILEKQDEIFDVDLKSNDSSEGADPFWESECFKKEADYWDKVIEPSTAATMAPMPGNFIDAMKTT